MLNFQLWIFPGSLLEVSWPVLMPRGCSSEGCSTTAKRLLNLLEEITVKPRGISWVAEEQ